MRRFKSNLLTVTAFAIATSLGGCGGHPGDSESGSRLAADGVSFDPVPTDVNIDCNYHILQGTQRFRGTYFVIPKVSIARDREDKVAIKLLPLANGNIAFDFALNFQRGTEARNTKAGLPDAERYANTCNFEKLRENINKHYEELKQPENKVWSLSPLPITNIEVRIDGIGKPVLMSPPDTNITTWLGETMSGSIELSQQDAERLMAKVSRGLGIQLQTAFKFEARETREFGAMAFNGASVARALEAQLGYDGPVASAVVLEGDLRTRLADALQTSSAEGYIESDSEKLSSAAESIIKMMVEKVSPKRLMATESRDTDASQDDSDDTDSKEGQEGQSLEEQVKRQLRREHLDRLEREARGTQHEEEQTEGNRTQSESARSIRDRLIRDIGPRYFADEGAAADGQGNAKPVRSSGRSGLRIAPIAFKVSAVLDYLRNQSNTKVQYRVMGKLVSETAAARSRMITGRVGASDESTVEVDSTEASRTLTQNLDAGKTLKLMVAGRKFYAPVTQPQQAQYLSKAALLEIPQRDGVNLEFPQLVEWGRKIYEYTPNEMTGARAYVYASAWNPFNWGFYVWGRVDHKVTETLVKEESADLVESSALRLNFSRVGRAYTLRNLFEMAHNEKDGDPFKVKAEDDGSLTITAKNKLGSVSIQNTESHGTREFVATEYFQETWSGWSNDRVQNSITWSTRKRMKTVPAGRSIITVRLLQGDSIPDVTFEEN